MTNSHVTNAKIFEEVSAQLNLEHDELADFAHGSLYLRMRDKLIRLADKWDNISGTSVGLDFASAADIALTNLHNTIKSETSELTVFDTIPGYDTHLARTRQALSEISIDLANKANALWPQPQT